MEFCALRKTPEANPHGLFAAFDTVLKKTSLFHAFYDFSLSE
jgi:hypothetical protein